MNKLLKDAIADAKAVRETALANAKVALEEAFAPRLQSMLSHKSKEEMEGEEGSEEMESEETKMEIARMKRNAGMMSEEDYESNDEEGSEEMGSEEEMDMSSEEGSEDMGSEEEMEMGSEEGMDMGSEEDQEVSDDDLEEILRELEGSEDEESEDMDSEAYKMENEDPEQKEMYEEEGAEEDEEIDLEEIINALKEEDESEEEMETEKDSKSEEDLEEAYNVIKFLRSKLNEVNLLNAKLLFVNKLFRKGELTESQKVKVIETFDRAKNVREAKLIYATLSESINGKTTKSSIAPKKKMNEGFASAPQKKTQIISESNDVFNNFKRLVNYNSNH